VLADRLCRLVHDLVAGRPAAFEREIEARQRDLEPEHVGCEHAERCFEQLLACLVALEDDNRARIHRRSTLTESARSEFGNAGLKSQAKSACQTNARDLLFLG